MSGNGSLPHDDPQGPLLDSLSIEETLRIVGDRIVNPPRRSLPKAPGREGPSYRMLSEYLADPSILEPPPCVAAHLAWEGRMTLLASAEKAGKSTLVGQAEAAVARGTQFLGRPTKQGVVYHLALDEPVEDLVRRLSSHGARDGVAIDNFRRASAALMEDLLEIRPRLIVFDTLTRFACGEVTDGGSRFQWVPVLGFIADVTRATQAAALILHHNTRSGERYSESAEIGAAVDQIIQMSAEGNERKLVSRGRVTFETVRLGYNGEAYHAIDSGELPMELALYRSVEANPGMGKRALRDSVSGRNADKEAVIAGLLRRGAIENRGSEASHSYYVCVEAGHDGSRSGHASGHTPREPRNSLSALAGHTSGNQEKTDCGPGHIEGPGHGHAESGHAGPGMDSPPPGFWETLEEPAA